MARTIKATRDNLNSIMEFDHVIEVHADGSVTEPRGIYAPELHDGEIEGKEWSLITMGYTGQHGYRGPLMHDSESIRGHLADDILAAPGVYVAVANYLDDSEGGNGGDGVEGWAVARRDV
jgi:hypothetical protein